MAEGTSAGLGLGIPLDRAPTIRACVTHTLRAAGTATTTSYVASSHARVNQFERVNVRFVYDWDDGTSIQWYYEWSADASTWHREQNVSDSAGTRTHTDQENTKTIGADGNWCDPLYVVDAYVRVQVKRTGGSGDNDLGIFLTGLGL